MQANALQRETEAAAPSRGEFVARAEALLPTIRAKADETERNRRLSDEAVAELLAANFHRILQPKRFGGYGLTLDVAADVVRTIASACGSSGWVTNLFILHNWQVSLFGQEAQEEYFGTAKDVLASTASFAPNSKFEPADGGFRISGRW